MPSEDTYHAKNPQVNAWMDEDGPVVNRGKNASAQLERLARRLKEESDELAKKISADTLRRLKYPVLEVVHEDGSRTFKHDVGIAEGAKPLIHK